MGFEGSNGSTGAPGMTDESPSHHGTATVTGTASISTAAFKFGTSSLLLNGGVIQFPDSNDWWFAGNPFTIDSNANVAYTLGTVISFVNLSANALTISITTDTMYLAGPGTTGSRTLAQYGCATALKTDTTAWIISGTGLT